MNTVVKTPDHSDEQFREMQEIRGRKAIMSELNSVSYTKSCCIDLGPSKRRKAKRVNRSKDSLPLPGLMIIVRRAQSHFIDMAVSGQAWVAILVDQCWTLEDSR